MNKPVTLIFYQGDGNDAKALAEKLRSEGVQSVFLRDAGSFFGKTDDPADKVIIMPDVSGSKRQLILETYPNVPRGNSYVDESEVGPILDKIIAEHSIKRGPGRPRKVV